ncbi:MAG: signal transduction protein [Pseudomonadota bacterium]
MKTILSTAISASLAVIMMLPAPSSAQEPGVSAALSRLDTDGDQAISREEAAAGRERMFERFDRNGDGVVDASEVQLIRDRIGAMARMADSMILLRSQRLDTDGDGGVSKAEFDAAGGMFDLADRDGDGRVSAAEIRAMRDRFMGGRQ